MKHKHFSLGYVLECLVTLGYGESDVAWGKYPVENNPYSFDLVIRKR